MSVFPILWPVLISYIDKVANNTFHASNQAIKLKYIKYSQLAVQQRAKFIPFAVEYILRQLNYYIKLLQHLEIIMDYGLPLKSSKLLNMLQLVLFRRDILIQFLAGYQPATQIINARNYYGPNSNPPVQSFDNNQQNIL